MKRQTIPVCKAKTADARQEGLTGLTFPPD
jgi:hypothetical protein